MTVLIQQKTLECPVERRVAVPFFDLSIQYREIEAAVMDSLGAVCSSQKFILGPRVAELEERIAAYCGCQHGVGVSSGSDALLAALMALDVGSGDEVITTPYTFFATGGAIARVGARPLFCDIDPSSYNIDPAAVEDLITRRAEVNDGRLVNSTTGAAIKALIPVHLYGQTADMDPLLELARRYKLKVIEDAAQAIGAEYEGGRRAGGMGDVGCLSFFPSKNLGAFGDGGMCVTNDPLLAERLRVLRVHGGKPKYHHAVIGGNFRLDELQAAVLLVKLEHLDRWTSSRQENARFYDEALEGARLTGRVSTPRTAEGNRHVFNQYVLRVEARNELQKHLASAGVGTEVYYPVPLHMQACFSALGYRPDDCPEACRAAAETLAIPIYPELDLEQKEQVVDAITGFYR